MARGRQCPPQRIGKEAFCLNQLFVGGVIFRRRLLNFKVVLSLDLFRCYLWKKAADFL